LTEPFLLAPKRKLQHRSRLFALSSPKVMIPMAEQACWENHKGACREKEE